MSNIVDFARVRVADPSDEEELMAMCRNLHAENGAFSMSEEKVRALLWRAFNRQDGLIGVIGASGRLEGSIYLLIDQLWYSNDWCLLELWNYVLPAYRRSTNAKELIAFAKKCSEALRLPLFIGILSNEQTEAKVRLYRRQLGTPAGAFFLVGTTTGRH